MVIDIVETTYVVFHRHVDEVVGAGLGEHLHGAIVGGIHSTDTATAGE